MQALIQYSPASMFELGATLTVDPLAIMKEGKLTPLPKSKENCAEEQAPDSNSLTKKSTCSPTKREPEVQLAEKQDCSTIYIVKLPIADFVSPDPFESSSSTTT